MHLGIFLGFYTFLSITQCLGNMHLLPIFAKVWLHPAVFFLLLPLNASNAMGLKMSEIPGAWDVRVSDRAEGIRETAWGSWACQH